MGRDADLYCADGGPFTDFGPSAFLLRRRRFHRAPVGEDFHAMRRTIRANCPNAAGVYGFIDRDGRLIYVGVSRRLRNRLATYFQRGEVYRKERRIAAHAAEFMWEEIGHEFAAQLRELELIRRHEPRLNVRGREHRRKLGCIYLTGDEAPRFRIGRHVPSSARRFWGPIATAWRMRETVEIVNHEFRLCDCPMSVAIHFADQRPLFDADLRLKCLRGEIGTCLGPCAGLCSRRQYAEQWRAACAFLDGEDNHIIDRIAGRLREAAAHQHYEQAAQLRDRLDRLQLLTRELVGLRAPVLPRNVVYATKVGRRGCWFLIVAGSVARAVPVPITKRGAASALAAIEANYFDHSNPPDETNRTAAHIVAAWFRTHPDESASIITPDEARQKCRDLLRT
jgi:excinuclease ABC subunit C